MTSVNQDFQSAPAGRRVVVTMIAVFFGLFGAIAVNAAFAFKALHAHSSPANRTAAVRFAGDECACSALKAKAALTAIAPKRPKKTAIIVTTTLRPAGADWKSWFTDVMAFGGLFRREGQPQSVPAFRTGCACD